MLLLAPAMGAWQVQRYENVKAGRQGITLNNIGTITFRRGGTGEKKLDYDMMGMRQVDHFPFTWRWNDGKYVTIEGSQSEFVKTWIIMTNKRKFQKWKSTDGNNDVQVMELKKQ